MKYLATGFLAFAVAYGSAASVQQQSPSNSSQNSQDVPHQSPGTNNPDLQQQRKPASKTGRKNRSSDTSSTHSDSSATRSEDVPHQEPGTNNPDLGQQRHPSPGTSSDTTQSTTSKKKSKRRTAKSSETSTGSQD
jgi:hypothetical protein